MREPYELIHNNRYRVSCRPDPTPEGAFLARVLVSWIDDTGAPLDHRLRPETAPFATAGEAAIVARDAAIRWLEARETGGAPGAGAAAAAKPAAATSAPLTSLEPGSALAAAPSEPSSPPADRAAYLAIHGEWQAAAAAFEATLARALADGGEPLDATRTAVDAAALKRLHERWIEQAVHLAVQRR